MVYYNETLKLCHELSELGKDRYEEMLESKADEILFRHYHPVKYFIEKIIDFLKQLFEK